MEKEKDNQPSSSGNYLKMDGHRWLAGLKGRNREEKKSDCIQLFLMWNEWDTSAIIDSLCHPRRPAVQRNQVAPAEFNKE